VGYSGPMERDEERAHAAFRVCHARLLRSSPFIIVASSAAPGSFQELLKQANADVPSPSSGSRSKLSEPGEAGFDDTAAVGTTRPWQ
jgi:hypothetical protein